MTVTIRQGDCRDILKTMDSGSVHMCCTSPPYFGLRSYGIGTENGEIGLEATPDAYVAEMVAVFRDVRRVLRDDGVLFLNLGDSYAGGGHGGGGSFEKERNWRAGNPEKNKGSSNRDGLGRVTGLKPKDLIGIPWAVATALRNPYYTGNIIRERDRVWLAAMIDGEGTICGFHHIRADDGRPRTGVHITITNSSVPLLDEAHRIWSASRSEHEMPGEGHFGLRPTFRWICHGTENKIQLLREVFPYLIVKRRQAIVAYNLLLLMVDAKRLGHSPQRDAVRDKRKALTDLLSALNQCSEPDMPPWLIEPPSVFEPGYYLRQDIIWAKSNPMPESVTDRCTKAHEYIFLLSKSARYFYDAGAIAEMAEFAGKTISLGGKSFSKGQAAGANVAASGNGLALTYDVPETRNKRSVWSVATQPYSEAHFATFPPDLIEPCIKAGCPEYTCPHCGTGLDLSLVQSLKAGTNGHDLSAVPIDLQQAPIQNGAQPILQPQVCQPCETTGDSPMHGVRGAGETRSQEQTSEVLLPEMLQSICRSESSNNEGVDDYVSGVSTCDGEGSSIVKSGRLCARTPPDSGTRFKSPAKALRSSSPQERGSARQSTGKLGSDAEGDARPAGQGGASTRSRSLPALPSTHPFVEPCPNCKGALSASSLGNGVVLDPFGGAGTTGLVADRLKRNAILIELNPDYAAMAERRIRGDAGMFAEISA